MNYRYLCLVLALVAGPIMAQNQFEQLHEIEVQQKQFEAAQQEKQRQLVAAQQAQEKRAYEAERARQQAQQQTYQRQQQAAAQKANEQAQAARAAQQAEQRHLQDRSERFEDEDRALALEERRIKLDAMKARAARTNDFVDAELKDSAARSDVIQSQADATRNISSGAKSLMESTGDAEVNRSNKLFGN